MISGTNLSGAWASIPCFDKVFLGIGCVYQASLRVAFADDMPWLISRGSKTTGQAFRCDTDEAFDRVRSTVLSGLAIQQQSPSSIARPVLLDLLFGHPADEHRRLAAEL